MTMYKREFNAPLSRYNSRKRELQTSMLEYSERVRALNAMQEETFLAENNAGLEIRAQRHHITRNSDPGHSHLPTQTNNNRNITTTTTTTNTNTTDNNNNNNNNNNHRRAIRRRPHSLDDKELLRNKQLNQSLVKAARRDAKSEYGHPPIVVPTQSTPSMSNLPNPPNSPDMDRSGNVRLNFVSTSDLYDLVDFGQNSKSSPRRYKARVSSVEDGMKLIEQIDLRSRRERKTAWGNNNNNNNTSSNKSRDDQSENGSMLSSSSSTNISQKNTPDSESGVNNVLGGFITGKSIQSRRKMNNNNNNNNNNSNSNKDYNNNNDSKEGVTPLKGKNASSKRPIHSDRALPVIKSADKNEIFPLNVFLETVLSSCKQANGKLRHRPKRAKRMQLHKSDLVVIPEDGDNAHANREKLPQCNGQGYSACAMPRHGTPVPSSSSLAAIKEGIARSKKQQGPMDFQESDFENVCNNNIKHDNATLEGSGKTPHKQKKKKHSIESLDAIIVKNSIIYPELPWESGRAETNASLVDFDHNNNNVGKHKKVKRLVFLRDQPENVYRR